MLLIHRAERGEVLIRALGEVLAAPSGDPFTPDVVAVPSRGVERWLAQQLSHVLGAQSVGAQSDGDGVCANVLFPSSIALLDAAAAAADTVYGEAVERWSAQRAVWPLMTVIEESAGSDWAAVLAVHLGLAGGPDRGRRFAVADKLARLFSSYSRARPAMLRAWHAGLDEQGDGSQLPSDLAWQAQLWRGLRAELGPAPAELLDAACERLRSDPAATALPERLSIFGATRISPSQVAVLTALAEHRELHLWLHHPSPVLWESVRGAGTFSRRADGTVRELRNPLLASLSRDIRELQQLLPEVGSTHHEAGPRPDTLLGRLQRELADDEVPTAPTPVQPDDRTLTVHACHGPARQVEVVREKILGLLRDDPTLEPRDIVIMCPDVESFAPLVAASFGLAEEPGGHPAAELRIKLADRALRQTNPMLSLLDELLDLAATRVTATQLLDLAGAESVRRRFGFTDDDIEKLRGWAGSANARWGLDAAHRAPYGLGSLDQGTWHAAVDRLLLGVAMEEGEQWIGDVLPLDDVDSGDIDLAGRFAEFVDRVDTAIRALAQPHPVPEWAALLGESVLALGEPLQAWQGSQLRHELDEVASAARDTDVRLTRGDIAALLHGRLEGRPTRSSFRTGTLTVCTLVPMRSVPHRVICLVGMDDEAFPRNGTVDGDDVLGRYPSTGERDVRSEDRQLFLDAICAAEQHLVITYTGADPRSGVEVPPCVPLGELLDAVDATALAPDGGRGRDHVVVRHPLQPFDARNFQAGALDARGPFSFDPAGLAGARAAATTRAEPRPLVSGALPAASDSTVELAGLVRFVVHPMREFLRQRLEISTWQDDDEPEDALPVDAGGLSEWAIGSRVLRHRLAGMSIETCQGIEQRRGDLPPGQLGLRLLTDVGSTVEALVGACAAERAEPVRSLDVAIPLDDGRVLAGTIGGLHGWTLLDVTYSSLGPRQRLECWVRYLALVAMFADPALRAVCIAKHRGAATRRVLRGIDPVEARGVLTDLVTLRDDGLRSPLPVATKTTAIYAERRFDSRSVDDALDAARSRWQDGQYDGECSDAAGQLVLGGRVSLAELVAFAPSGRDDLRFDAVAMRLWSPLLSAEEQQ